MGEIGETSTNSKKKMDKESVLVVVFRPHKSREKTIFINLSPY